MFFTLQSVQTFVVDIDGFLCSGELLEQIIGVLVPRYQLIGVTGSLDETSEFIRRYAASIDVFVSPSRLQTGLFQNVIRSALGVCETDANAGLFISASASRIRAAHELLMGTVAFVIDVRDAVTRRDIFRSFPDFVIDEVAELERLVDGQLIGFGGEYLARAKGAFLIDKQVKKPVYLAGQVPNL